MLSLAIGIVGTLYVHLSRRMYHIWAAGKLDIEKKHAQEDISACLLCIHILWYVCSYYRLVSFYRKELPSSLGFVTIVLLTTMLSHTFATENDCLAEACMIISITMLFLSYNSTIMSGTMKAGYTNCSAIACLGSICIRINVIPVECSLLLSEMVGSMRQNMMPVTEYYFSLSSVLRCAILWFMQRVSQRLPGISTLSSSVSLSDWVGMPESGARNEWSYIWDILFLAASAILIERLVLVSHICLHCHNPIDTCCPLGP